MEKFYTTERNVQIVIGLLKAHGIRKVIASPGTTNMTFIGSIQNDPYFQIWSSVDERSAAYLACGMAAETGEPVVISCTGATASRNYMPGLTEAYYRKLPVLAITSHRGNDQIGHLIDQQIDRRSIPNDVARCSVTIPMARNSREERFCEIEANKAILALNQDGGGPVHINMYTEYCQDFTVKTLPKVNAIFRYTQNGNLPSMPVFPKIGVCVGSHHNFSEEETAAIDKFCLSRNAVVFCDPTSGYDGKYRFMPHLVCSQVNYFSDLMDLDLMIHIGEVLGTNHVRAKEVWRVSEDGELRDTYGKLTKVFQMPEKTFFELYATDNVSSDDYLKKCKEEYYRVLSKIPEIPFGNIWIAKNTLPKMPHGCEIHLGIYNSLRSWSFFEWPESVNSKCNVGGFGIDGALSTMIGASLARPDKILYCILGDLAFFYDMNVIGNRHVGNNIRILLINNGKGAEFRLFNHPCYSYGEGADKFMAAAGHYGNQSSTLVKSYAEALGYEYRAASSKDEYLKNLDWFVSPESKDKPMIFEVFTNSDEEDKALKSVQTAYMDSRGKLKKVARMVLGETGMKTVKTMIKR